MADIQNLGYSYNIHPLVFLKISTSLFDFRDTVLINAHWRLQSLKVLSSLSLAQLLPEQPITGPVMYEILKVPANSNLGFGKKQKPIFRKKKKTTHNIDFLFILLTIDFEV